MEKSMYVQLVSWFSYTKMRNRKYMTCLWHDSLLRMWLICFLFLIYLIFFLTNLPQFLVNYIKGELHIWCTTLPIFPWLRSINRPQSFLCPFCIVRCGCLNGHPIMSFESTFCQLYSLDLFIELFRYLILIWIEYNIDVCWWVVCMSLIYFIYILFVVT